MSKKVDISVPQRAKIVVSVGTQMSLKTPMYTISDTEVLQIPITKPLKVKPEDIFQVLTCVIGDTIKVDDLLASKKGILGTKKVYSPVSGILSHIDHEKGTVNVDVEKSETKSYSSIIEGKVTTIDKANGSMTIEIVDGQEVNAKTVTHTVGGEAIYVSVDFFSVDQSQIKNKVVITQEITPALASKFEVLGCLAIVFVKGDHTTQIAYAQMRNDDDFGLLVNSKRNKIALLSKQNKIITY